MDLVRRATSPVFVGRKTELAVLGAAFEDTAGGRSRTVLVGAEAGGGKTRLTSEFVAGVRERAQVLSGDCVALSAAELPYAPFTAALRRLVGEQGTAEVAALLPEQDAGELARLLPDFGTPAAEADPAAARSRLFELLLTLLERLAERRPLVLVVEDVHWADPLTQDLLTFLVRNLRQAAVLLVVTYRSDELHRSHSVRRLLAELDRVDGVTSLELPRLTRAEVAAQLEGILDHPPEPALVGAVYERTDGIPLFTEALVGPGGALRAEPPGPLRNLLLGAVRQLPERTQQVLRTVAEGGVQVGHALLRAVTGLDDAALTAALRPAVAANVLVGDADGYAFRHELFRDAVRGELLAGERIQVHRAFAETLEATPSLGPEAMPAVQRALHWRGACEYERAFVTAWHAAADAAASRAYGVRLGMLEQVLELWGRVPNAAKQIGADRVDVVGLAADAARWAGEPERGLTLVEAGLSELGEEHDGERVASLLLRRAALRQQLLLPGQIDDLRAALRLVRSPTLERAQILGQLCRALLLRDRYGEAKQLAAEMRSLAAQLGDEECQTEALIALAQIATRQGADAVAALQEARAKAQRIGSGRLELMAWVEITHTLEGRGRHEHAIEAGREGLARARQLGLARYVAAPIAQNLAESLTSTGCWDEALEIAEEALSLDPAPFGRMSLLLCRGQITLARGDPETAARTVRELRALPASSAETQRALPLARLEVEWRLAQGDHAGALATAAGAVCAPDVDTDPRYLWPLLTTAMRVCAEAGPATVPGDIDDPAELRKILEQRAANTAADGPVERAHAAMFRAEASRASGQPDPAAWDATAAAWESLGEPYPQAYALLRAAHAAAATGDRDTTINRLQRAAKLAGQLSAELLLRQIRHLARRARIDLTADSAAAPTLPFGLTPRELEVLRLVAAGLSNRQIATELFISVKTASVHVSNILGKLGVPTRNEAAATAHRLHIFDAGTPDGPANPGLALRSPTSR